jgi:homoserine kinase
VTARAVEAVAPATAGNVLCGFDLLGLAVDGPGDRVIARRSATPGAVMRTITGDDGELPMDAALNTASVAAAAVLRTAAVTGGVVLDLHKGLPLGSGLGSSAASAAAAAVATDRLYDIGLDRDALILAAAEGERAACGSLHLDNIGPAIAGGLVLCRDGRVHPLPVPHGLCAVVLAVPVRSDTRGARAAVPDALPVTHAVAQGADVAAFVLSVHTGDWDLLAASLTDRVAEPYRVAATPGFAAIHRAAMDAGALGAGLSGAGPAMLALCRGSDVAQAVARAMTAALHESTGLAGTTWVGPPAARGAHVVAVEEA